MRNLDGATQDPQEECMALAAVKVGRALRIFRRPLGEVFSSLEKRL